MKMRLSGLFGVLLFVIAGLSLAPPAGLLGASAQGGGIELAVDNADFNQDGLLVLFGGLQSQGALGLPVAAGDINGDGKADIMFCGMFGSSDSRVNNGVVNIYISDGRDSGFLDAALSPSNIYKVVGQRRGDLLGTSISATGDVNGDGIRDIAVGASRHDGPGGDRFNSGATYVVFGSRDFHMNADLATADGNPPPGVIAIYGPQIEGRSGVWVDEGDVDGDGIADIIIGSDQINSGAAHHVGGAYIVFGSRSLPPVIDLVSPPAGVRTAKIIGQGNEEHWGAAVQAGDINDDGIADILIGGAINRSSGDYVTPEDPYTGHGSGAASNGGPRVRCGEAYVIYGQRNWPSSTDLRTPPATATHVIGANNRDFLGSQLHSADINGDGKTDLILGALHAAAPDLRETGAVYIVYGQPGVVGATIDLANVAASGLRLTSIFGEQEFACAGDSVRSFDINGDGRSDLFIGSPNMNLVIGGQTRSAAGDTKIIFGQRDFLPEVIKLYNLAAGPRIFRIAGARGFEQSRDDGDEFSYSLAGGDVDGDGYVDYVSNALHGDGFNNLLDSSGNVYIFSGRKLSAKAGFVFPEITSVTARRKSSGLILLKITGSNFTADGTVTASTNGSPLKLKATSIDSGGSASAKIKASSAPEPGTVIQVRVLNALGIPSREAAVIAP